MRNLAWLYISVITLVLLSACGPAEKNTVVNNFAPVAVSPSYTVEEVSPSQSQYYGQLTGPGSFTVIELVVTARADLTISSFDFSLNTGGSLAFSDPQLIDSQGNLAGVPVAVGHLQYRFTLDTTLSLRAGESAQFQVVLEVFASPGESGVIQATLTGVGAVSQSQVIDFSGPVAGPLVIFEGAPLQVMVENLFNAGGIIGLGENELLRVRITAIENVSIPGLNVTLFKTPGIEIQSIQVLNGQGSDLGSFTFPFQTQSLNQLGGSLLFNTPIQLQAGQEIVLEYRAVVGFTNSNLGLQAVLDSVPGVALPAPIVGPYQES